MLDELPEIFSSLDTVGDGRIALNQLSTCLRVAGLTPTEGIIEKMTKQWAGKPETRLSVEDVKPIYTNIQKELGTDASFESISACLAHFDREGNGTLTLADLRFVMTSAGDRLLEKEVDILLSGFYIADESKVSITEFVKYIQSL